MWVLAEYLPTALFSLRAATATSSGGKTLITPTPFSVKMALLDACLRTQGEAAGRALFPALVDLDIAIRLPDQIAVNTTFTKILRKNELKNVKPTDKAAAIEDALGEGEWPFKNTIAYREYVHFAGPLWLAFEGLVPDRLIPLLLQVNYLGKRGGFMQLRSEPALADDLPGQYTRLTAGQPGGFPLGVLQLVDDFGSSITFEHANVFSAKGMTLGKERVLRHVVLPYRMARSSRSFTLYERFDD